MAKKLKETLKPKRNKKKIALIIVLIIAILIALWLWLGNGTLYRANKDASIAKLSATLSDIKLSQPPAYSNISVSKCSNGGGVVFENNITCDIFAQRFYQSKSDIKSDITQVNQILLQHGWHYVDYNNASSAITQRSIAVSKGEATGSARYLNNKDSHETLILYTEIKPNGKHLYNASVSELIDQHILTTPQKNESIYGIEITKTYWSCEDSIPSIPCPPTPN